MFDLIQLKSPR